MRCCACDNLLTQIEMGRKSPATGEDYLLCTECLLEAGLLHQAIENPLAEEENDDTTDPDFYDRLGDQNDS